MTCASCVSNIERSLSKVDGIHGILVALLSQKAEILYDGELIDSELIIDQIEDLGYSASLLSEKGNSQLSEISFKITGMTCSSCVHKIETTLNNLEGRFKFTFNLSAYNAPFVFRRPFFSSILHNFEGNIHL